MNDSEIIYLDHAAATPLDPYVLTVMTPYFFDFFYNPSSPYAPAVKVHRQIEEARAVIAQAIGAKPDGCIITAGATESINLALTAAAGGHIVTTTIEHDAVLQAASQYPHTFVAVDERGMVDPSKIQAAIQPDTRVVSVALANNEIGTVQRLRHIAEVVEGIRNQRREEGNQMPIWLHTDASQGVGQIDVNTARLGVDMMTLNSGKIYGPKQVGLLWVAPEVKLSPLVRGGGQERGLRSGTENAAGIIGFATALEQAERKRKSEAKRLAGLRDMLERRLTDTFSHSIVSGHPKRRLPGSLHISFPGLDAERLVFLLEARGVLVATGSACAANKATRSHVLTAIGLAPEVADGSLRITLGKLNDEVTTKRAGDILIDVITSEMKRMGQA